MDVQSSLTRIEELEQQLAACNEAVEKLQSQTGKPAEDHFRQLFAYSRDIILIMERVTGQILDANPAAIREYGYTLEELRSLTIHDLRTDLTREFTNEQMARAEREGILFETQHCRKDGSAFLVEVSSQGAIVEQKRALISIIRNITERKEAEKERLGLIEQIEKDKREAEYQVEELTAIIEAMNDPVMVYSQNGDVFRSNAAAVKVHGLDPSRQSRTVSLKTMLIREIDGNEVNFEDLPSSMALRGIPVIRRPLEIINKDGVRMFLQVTAMPLVVNGVQKGAVSVWHNITDLKRYETAMLEALNEAEGGSLMLETILANLPAGMAITGGPPDFLISRVSHYGADLQKSDESAMTGFPAGEHWRHWNWYLPDGVTRPDAAQMPLYRAACYGESTSSQEFVVEVEPGEKIPVTVKAVPVRNNRGDIVAAISVWSDISHIKAAEEALRQHNEALRISESKFHSMFQSAPFAMSLLGIEGKHYVEVNEAWCKLMEYNKEEVIGKSTQDLHPIMRPEVNEHMQNLLEENGYIRDCEIEISTRSGNPLIVSYNTEIVKIDQQYYLLNTIENITERRNAENAMKMYAAELERSNNELQEFAFVASHDLQEPLRKIEAFSDLLLEDTHNLTERQADLLSRLKNSTRRMRSMVAGLLQLSRVSTDTHPFQVVDLNQLISDVLSDLERCIQSVGAKIAMDNMPVVEADSLQIYQLFQNLISNALKFQPAGRTPLIKIYARQADKNFVNIHVKDNGIGLDARHFDSLFQPFRRFVNRRDYEGNGMGLAICRKIVERHGGKISVESIVDRGATFIVTLPIHQKKHTAL